MCENMSEGAVQRRWLENDHVRVEQESTKHDCCVVVRKFLNLISVIFGRKCETEQTNFLNSIKKLLQGSGGPAFITPTYDESDRNVANFRALLYRVKKASTRAIPKVYATTIKSKAFIFNPDSIFNILIIRNLLFWIKVFEQ